MDSSPFVCGIMKSEDGLKSACPAERPLFGGPVSGRGRSRYPDGARFVETQGLSLYELRHIRVGSTRLSFVEQTLGHGS
jgi:hypothetical protein